VLRISRIAFSFLLVLERRFGQGRRWYQCGIYVLVAIVFDHDGVGITHDCIWDVLITIYEVQYSGV